MIFVAFPMESGVNELGPRRKISLMNQITEEVMKYLLNKTENMASSMRFCHLHWKKKCDIHD